MNPPAGVRRRAAPRYVDIVADLKASGVTIILTTHYIEEAEAIADRIGVIATRAAFGRGLKTRLNCSPHGQKATGRPADPSELTAIPQSLASDALTLSDDGQRIDSIP